MSEFVTVDINEGVAHVQLNRPDRHNALHWELFKGLEAAAQSLAADPGVRAVVLSGNGPSFCSGLDYPVMSEHPTAFTEGFAKVDGAEGNLFQMMGWFWKRLPVPVIAAIHGNCFGGGIQIALGADIRFATAEAKLSVMEIKWGLIPDMSGTLTLRELVRADVAKELTFTGRIFTGAEAAEIGVVTRVVEDPVDAALNMAREIANKNPEAIRLAKSLLDENRLEADAEKALLREKEGQLKILGSPNQREAARAAMTKTAPQFDDPRF